MKSNNNFVCAWCGQQDDFPSPSHLEVSAWYGSIHDRERLIVPICGDCCDRLFAQLEHKPGAVLDSPWE